MPRTALALTLLLFSTSAGADTGICEIVDAQAPAATVLISPGGLAPSLAEQGVAIEAVVWYVDSTYPCVNYPWEDLTIGASGSGTLNFCGLYPVADSDTDEFGRVTLDGTPFGGGHDTAGIRVLIAGVPYDEILPIAVNSPDIDGNLVVDIGDFALFGLDFGRDDAFRSDFVHDGIVDIADFSLFGLHFGESCP